jgi:anti-sigma factor RsiW
MLGRRADGELDDDVEALERHLAGCAACAVAAGEIDRIGRTLRSARVPAPAGLDDRILGALDSLAAPTAPQRPQRDGRVGFTIAWPWPAAAMLLLTALASALVTFTLAGGPGERRLLMRDAVTAYLRAQLVGPGVEIASADPHTVKPWFAGRVEFAPQIRDLAGEGFPLVGGRLDFVGERRVGVAVYKRRLHVINLYMWAAPGSEPTAPAAGTERGYNLVSWTRNGVTYLAVSDLNVGELMQFQAGL